MSAGLTKLVPAERRSGRRSHSDPVEPQPRRDKLEAAEPIVLGDNVRLGGGVIVCPGATIGENSVVGAGAVVTRDIPANVLALGNPARGVRSL